MPAANEVRHYLAQCLRSQVITPKALVYLEVMAQAIPISRPWVFQIRSAAASQPLRFWVNGRQMNHVQLADQCFSASERAEGTTHQWLRAKRALLDSHLDKPEVRVILLDIESVYADSGPLKELREAYLLGFAAGTAAKKEIPLP